jgi:hypothetical protein
VARSGALGAKPVPNVVDFNVVPQLSEAKKFAGSMAPEAQALEPRKAGSASHLVKPSMGMKRATLGPSAAPSRPRWQVLKIFCF